MAQNLKKNRQRGAIIIPFLIIAGIFALIGGVGWLANLDLAERIGYFFFILIFSIVAMLATSFASLTSWILQLVISPGFTSLSYTKPYGPNANPVIDAGLSITQGFANMILVLVLVFIALATILRLAGYETKKLLPAFIIIAILVNFAPVVVGLVVDAANIVMNYFVSGLFQFAVISAELSNLWQGLNVFGGTIDETRSNFFYAAAVAVFGFFLGVAYFTYALVFIVRYVAIWALTILSPLAFVAYILPATRGLWKKWWEQLVQWSFIGVTAGFFLYLASHVAAGARNWFVVQTAGSPQIGPISVLLVYLVPLVFLYLGLALGMATSAMGASAVIKVANRGQKWVGTKVGKGVGRFLEEKLRVREDLGKIVGKWEKAPVARWFLPEAARKYVEFRPAVEKGKEETSPYSSKVVAGRIAAGTDYGVKAVGGMLTLIDRGDMQDLFKAYMDKYKVKTEAELYNIPEFRDKMARLMQIAIRAGQHNTILRGDPRLARYAFEQLPGYSASELQKEGFYGSPAGAVEKATTEARRTHIGHWEREVVTDEDVVGAGLTKGTEFWSAIDTQVKKGQETSLNTIDKMFTDFIDSRGLAHTTQADIDTAWGEWENEFQARFPGMKGYFESVRTDRRFTARGWRRGNYVVPGAPPPPTPGAAAGVCLAEDTFIDTPSGAIAVQILHKGIEVWTLNRSGVRVPAKIIKIVRTPVPSTHRVVHLVLDDGRELFASLGHPTGDGRTVGDIHVGDPLGERYITAAEVISYQKGFTYDILPDGDTGLYWANDILLGSTLFHTDRVDRITKTIPEEKLVPIK